MREQLVKQRMEQRLQSAKKIRILDMEKCPLLSKPGEMYMKSKQTVKPKQQQGEKPLLDSSLTSNSWMSTKNNLESHSNLTISSSNSHINTSSNNRSKPLLRIIYPSSSYHQQSSKSSNKMSSGYDRLKVVEHIADIFMCFTLFARSKFLSHFGFRSFIK